MNTNPVVNRNTTLRHKLYSHAWSDHGRIAILILLVLSAAFDPIDHTVLIDWLEKWVRIFGVALNWFFSYLSNWIFFVIY